MSDKFIETHAQVGAVQQHRSRLESNVAAAAARLIDPVERFPFMLQQQQKLQQQHEQKVEQQQRKHQHHHHHHPVNTKFGLKHQS